jgi:hypothetical protein
MTDKSQFKPLGAEDQKILDWMKKMPRSNGEIGYNLSDGPEAVEWLRYYKAKYPHKVPYMLSRIREGKSYVVAAKLPHYFDTTWGPRETKRTLIFPPLPPESQAKRIEIVNRLLKGFGATASG